MISNRIKELRLERGWSIKDLADKAKLPKSNISLYENEGCNPSYWSILELARTLDVSVDYLCGITKERRPYPHE